MTEFPRYAPSDFPTPPASAPIPLRREGAAAPAGQIEGDAQEITLVEDAEPPGAKLMALCDNEPKFRKAWRRQRPDLADTSASGYSLSLMWYAAAAGWSKQEAINLVIAWRREHNEDPKLDRPDWYQRTYDRARESQTQGWTETAFVAAAGPAAAAAAGPDAVLEILRQALGVPLARVLRRESPEHARVTYLLVLEDGRQIDAGVVDNIVDLRRFRVRLFEVTGATMPAMKQDRWLPLASLIADTAEVEEFYELSATQELWQWVTGYIRGREADSDESYQDAIREGRPFARDGKVHIRFEKFSKWVREVAGERLPNTDLKRLLLAAGLRARPLSLTIERTSRSYYVGPDRSFESENGPPLRN